MSAEDLLTSTAWGPAQLSAARKLRCPRATSIRPVGGASELRARAPRTAIVAVHQTPPELHSRIAQLGFDRRLHQQTPKRGRPGSGQRPREATITRPLSRPADGPSQASSAWETPSAAHLRPLPGHHSPPAGGGYLDSDVAPAAAPGNQDVRGKSGSACRNERSAGGPLGWRQRRRRGP